MERKPYRRPDTSNRSAGTPSASRQTYASRSRAPQPRRNNSATAAQARARSAARPMPRRRKRDPIAIVAPILIALALLAGVVYTGSSWFISTINKSTYCSNIYVNGIDVSRYSQEEGAESVRAEIDSRLNTNYTLSWGDSSWTFSAADFNGTIETDSIMNRAWNIGHVGNIFDRSASIRSLKSNPIYLTAPLVYDKDLVSAYVDAIYDQLYIAPKDAQVAADLSNPYLASEAASGQELDKETAREQIISLLETGEGGSVLPVIELEPAISTEQAMSSLDLIITYRTDTSARGYNGRFNVRKALMAFYGMIVQPGEIVSFNEVVGPRSEQRGWQKGTEYIGGGKTQEGYGGGVCQASSTLYGALLKAGMTIMERSPHSMTVAYVDPSIDAAVSDDRKDLVFCNNTPNPITIYTEVTPEYATVQIYGVRPEYRYELESVIVRQDSQAVKTSYIADTEGKHCYFIDETALYKEGHAACTSQGWLIAYDWETGEEVSRLQLSSDNYESGYDIYWRGIHTRDGGIYGQDGSTGAVTTSN